VFMQPRVGGSDPFSTLKTAIWTDDELRSVLDAYKLFPSDNRREKRLRGSVFIERLSRNAFRVSFGYPDARTAQQVTRDLEVMIANSVRANTDLSFVAYEDPNVPRTSERPHRLALVVIGLLGGAMLGVLAAFIRRARPPVPV
jgi:hypothetical protein